MADEYKSRWTDQINAVVDRILNREPFQYDPNGDAMFQQYQDRYINQGKMAMMDTMGQAQAMTGGYGNSYAQAVGQQAYQTQLQGLNDKIPELYQLALDRYTREGQDLTSKYSLLASQDDADYGRFRDTVGDSQWQAEFDEGKRQFDATHYLGDFALKYDPSQDTTPASTPKKDEEEKKYGWLDERHLLR